MFLHQYELEVYGILLILCDSLLYFPVIFRWQFYLEC